MENTEKSAREKRWRRFWHSHIENGLLDNDRAKTKKALWQFSGRMPEIDFDRIPTHATVFAPSADTLGLVEPERKGVTIYLSPLLEKMPQSRVGSVVAHEFAHAILGHDEGESFAPDKAPRDCRELPSEMAADSLIQKWGYVPANSFMKTRKQRKGV